MRWIVLAAAWQLQPTPDLPAFCRAPDADAAEVLRAAPLACRFDRAAMRFAGTPIAQARCLLRPVGPGGVIGAARRLPRALERRIGRPVEVDASTLRRYLAATGVTAAEIGGEPDRPLAVTQDGTAAAYFVIHDTSTPNVGLADFPADRDAAGWSGNDLTGWAGPDASAHLFVARTGASLTTHDFAVPWRATKAESCVLGLPARGLFLHVELAQPRRSDPAGPPGNDRIAPQPGFAPAQLDRLALAYLAASVRAGHWLIPAFHAAIDAGLADAHDDPQRFALADWARRVEQVDAAVHAGKGRRGRA